MPPLPPSTCVCARQLLPFSVHGASHPSVSCFTWPFPSVRRVTRWSLAFVWLVRPLNLLPAGGGTDAAATAVTPAITLATATAAARLFETSAMPHLSV